MSENKIKLPSPVFSWESLEIYKGFALCSMIGLHTTVWSISTGCDGDIRFAGDDLLFIFYPYLVVFGIHALSFAFSAGTSLYFWLQSGKSGSPSLLSVLLRVGILAGAGYFINLNSWYIFQFLALATLVSYFLLRFTGIYGLFLVGLCTVFFAAPLQKLLLPWASSYWVAILSGSTGGVYFWPFFPWFFLFALGAMVGYLKLSKFVSDQLFRKLLLIVGLSCVNLYFFSQRMLPDLKLVHIWSSMFQPDPARLIQWAGIMLTSLALIDYLVHTRFKAWLNWFKPISAHSLVLYFIHYLIFVKVVFYYKNFSTTRLYFLIVGQIIAVYFIGAFLSRLSRTAALMRKKRV